MKTIILSLFISLLSLNCTAQTQIVALNDCNKQYDYKSGDAYLKDTTNEIDKYTGTWKWTSGNREFTLTLIKQIKYHYNQGGGDNYYRDRLMGYYQYRENGVLIADTSSDDLSQDYGAKVHFGLNCHSQMVSISFNDYLKKKNYEVELKKLSPTQMEFKGRMHEGSIFVPRNGTVTIPGGHTFPLEMVLTKQ
ncbi:DUF6705 family protein [Chryseobacterium hispalense]|uniref:DUF6705 family protein n=1 Tax=Chryseobacterium hispalense TaxID=1453492 RepID=UPI003918B50C